MDIQNGVKAEEEMDEIQKAVKPASIYEILVFAKKEKWYIIGGVLLALARGLSWWV